MQFLNIFLNLPTTNVEQHSSQISISSSTSDPCLTSNVINPNETNERVAS
eukprot:m.174821 g.174821  ORF g.174821 m.174821 type:complete len:50 (-) comp31785_c1_seq1:413-562(-)